VSLSIGRYSSVPIGAALCTLERHHSREARGTAANPLPALSGTTARQAQQQSEKIFGDSCSTRQSLEPLLVIKVIPIFHVSKKVLWSPMMAGAMSLYLYADMYFLTSEE
jgi:hypothetical protein